MRRVLNAVIFKDDVIRTLEPIDGVPRINKRVATEISNVVKEIDDHIKLNIFGHILNSRLDGAYMGSALN
jgi:hypothetical protein